MSHLSEALLQKNLGDLPISALADSHQMLLLWRRYQALGATSLVRGRLVIPHYAGRKGRIHQSKMNRLCLLRPIHNRSFSPCWKKHLTPFVECMNEETTMAGDEDYDRQVNYEFTRHPSLTLIVAKANISLT